MGAVRAGSAGANSGWNVNAEGSGATQTAVGGGGGFNGYAKTLEQARQRAEYYMSNGYAAPEVKAGEKAVLDEVNRLEGLDKESN